MCGSVVKMAVLNQDLEQRFAADCQRVHGADRYRRVGSWAELTCLPWPHRASSWSNTHSSHSWTLLTRRSGRSRRSTTTWENGAPSPSEQTSCTAREYTRWLVSSVEQLVLEEENIAIARCANGSHEGRWSYWIKIGPIMTTHWHSLERSDRQTYW